MKAIVGLTVCASVPHGSLAQQLQAPSDIDLRTAYCMKVAQQRLVGLTSEPSQHPLMVKLVADTNADLARMQAYLVPKVSYLEPVGLLAAQSREQADAVEAFGITKQCFATCTTGSVGADKATAETAGACVDRCTTESAAFARARTCHPINWLPF